MECAIIIAEKKNGSSVCGNAYICKDESDFISRISALALQRRSDEALNIETAAQAIGYLNETFAQSTDIITKDEFDSMTVDSWSNAVLEKAEELGWHEVPTDADEE